MNPPALERLGLRPNPNSFVHGGSDRGLMARSLMWLFVAGAAITLASLPLQHGEADQARMALMAASATAISAVLFAGYDRLPAWAFPLFLACGSLMIEWTIYVSEAAGSPYAMFWFWLAIYAFYFLSRGQALLQLGVIAAAYAAVLASVPDAGGDTAVRWAVTTSALIVAGAMIGTLKERLDRAISKLESVSRADPDTGLPNRRALSETLARSLELARRTNAPVALAVGRPADGVDVTRLGRELADAVRRTDVAARIGERTFALIAPGTGDHGAYVMAEQLQRALPGSGLCFGIAGFPRHGDDADDLLAAAEGALAEALALGEGRVVTCGAERTAVA